LNVNKKTFIGTCARSVPIPRLIVFRAMMISLMLIDGYMLPARLSRSDKYEHVFCGGRRKIKDTVMGFLREINENVLSQPDRCIKYDNSVVSCFSVLIRNTSAFVIARNQRDVKLKDIIKAHVRCYSIKGRSAIWNLDTLILSTQIRREFR